MGLVVAALAFTVYGTPQPAGSKRGFARGSRVVIVDANAKSRPWKALVTDAAIEAMQTTDRQSRILEQAPLLDGPLRLELDFYVPRPKGHYGVKGVRPSAPDFPAVKPDVLKLARAVEDALSGIVYRDDAQIVTEWLSKRYGEPARVEVLVAKEAA
jgi:Holliday junction resolvase RusA-like endonuclease